MNDKIIHFNKEVEIKIEKQKKKAKWLYHNSHKFYCKISQPK